MDALRTTGCAALTTTLKGSCRTGRKPGVEICDRIRPNSQQQKAFGAHGEKVSNPDDVPAALKRCVDAIRGGRTAILHVRVTKL
jgi:acetolactate synthase I/II/III large subunit